MFKYEIILNQILVNNNLTSIEMAGKPKIIQPREDEERILCVKKNSELTQENKDLAEEIVESIEVAEGKDKLVLKLAQENLKFAERFCCKG